MDLFLETELFVDVRLTDADLQALAAVLEQRRLQQLKDEHMAIAIAQQQAQVLLQARAKAIEAQEQKQQQPAPPPSAAGAASSSSSSPSSASSPPPAPPLPPLPPPIPQPSVSSIPITPSSLRRWHEAEIREVHGRNVRVHFLQTPLPPQWINVDEGHDRLAELHVMTTAEREGRVEKKEELDLGVDCDDVFEEVIARCNVKAVLSDPLLCFNGRVGERDSVLQQAKEQFVRRWFSSAPQVAVQVDGDVDMGTEGDEVRSESLTIPLFDPLTQSRLTVPVRTAACQHVHCMDLMTHVQQQKNRLEWKCVCGKDAYSNLLQVDLFLLYILREVTGTPSSSSSSSSSSPSPSSSSSVSHEWGVVAETRHVVIHSDGSWRVQEERDREKRKRKRDAADSSSSSSAASSPASTPLVQSASAASASPSPTSSTATQSLFSLYPMSFPVVLCDGVECIDLREDQPHDAAILDWLVQHWKVKTEKLEQQRRIQQQQQAAAQEERKLPPPAPLPPPFFSPVPSPSPRSQLAMVISPHSSQPPPPPTERVSRVKQLRQAQLQLARQQPSLSSSHSPNHSQYPPSSSSLFSPIASPSSSSVRFSFSPSSSSSAPSAAAAYNSFLPRTDAMVIKAMRRQSNAASSQPSSIFTQPSNASGSAAALQPLPRTPSESSVQRLGAVASTMAIAQRQPPSPAYPPSSTSSPQSAPPHPAPAPPRQTAPRGPPRPPAPRAPPRADPAASPSEVLNVNTCNEWQLQKAGFSYNVSKAIIAARQEKGAFGFQRMDELLDIKGVGKKTYEKLQLQLQI